MPVRIAFSKLALAAKIPAEDKPAWARLNGSFVNLELDTIDIANAIYTGHPFTIWHKNNWRHSDNYILGQHLALDFDTGDVHSTIATLRKDTFIAKFAAMIYTTPSHTPETPRARVVFTLDIPIYQATNYALSATALTWLFGHADRQCKDAARFFYGNPHCTIEYLGNVLPLDIVRETIKRYQASGRQEKRRHEQPRRENLDADRILRTVIGKAQDGDRNSLGYWLACTLLDEGVSRTDVESYMLEYQRAVTGLGRQPYSEVEAITSVKSALRRAA